MTSRLLLPLLFVLVFLGGCATREPFGQGDTGRKITVDRGDNFTVQLGGNPVGGRTWQVVSVDENVIRQRGDPHSEALVAVGGAARMWVYTYKFRAVAAGTTQLRMEYRDPRDLQVTAIETFELTVEVR